MQASEDFLSFLHPNIKNLVLDYITIEEIVTLGYDIFMSLEYKTTKTLYEYKDIIYNPTKVISWFEIYSKINYIKNGKAKILKITSTELCNFDRENTRIILSKLYHSSWKSFFKDEAYQLTKNFEKGDIIHVTDFDNIFIVHEEKLGKILRYFRDYYFQYKGPGLPRILNPFCEFNPIFEFPLNYWNISGFLGPDKYYIRFRSCVDYIYIDLNYEKGAENQLVMLGKVLPRIYQEIIIFILDNISYAILSEKIILTDKKLPQHMCITRFNEERQLDGFILKYTNLREIMGQYRVECDRLLVDYFP
jgi:hypothetical protein